MSPSGQIKLSVTNENRVQSRSGGPGFTAPGLGLAPWAGLLESLSLSHDMWSWQHLAPPLGTADTRGPALPGVTGTLDAGSMLNQLCLPFPCSCSLTLQVPPPPAATVGRVQSLDRERRDQEGVRTRPAPADQPVTSGQ